MTIPVADYRLSVDGQDFTPRARPRLISLSLTEKRGKEADQLELTLDDADGLLALPKKGAIITLALGWLRGGDDIGAPPAGLIDKGRFKVDEVGWGGPPDQITIRARSADLTAGFRARKEKSFRGTTLGAVARDIAAANGLTAKVAPELAGIAVPILTQHQQSDMALLERLGREHDAVATVKDGKLILSPIGKGATSSGKKLPTITLTRADGGAARYNEVDRSDGAGVEARWHDVDSGQRKTVKAGGGSGGGTPRRLRKVHHSEADARAAAQAEAGRAKRAAAEFSMKLALGRADLYPETGVKLAGFKPPIDARSWILAEVTHRLDARGGFSTDIKLETK